MTTIAIENYHDQEIEIPVERYGWYLDVDRAHLRLSDSPHAGLSSVHSCWLANPSEVPGKHGREQLFELQFGAYASECFLVWSHGFEDALEIAAETALEMGFRGLFVDNEEMKRLYDEAREELGEDAEEDEVAQHAETDLTYTESGWIPSWEWHGHEVDGDLLKATTAVCEDYMADQDELEPNARGGEFDAHAATELELYIENEYKLVGADNSQGKLIEKNLKRKIQRGQFDYESSIDAWAHLIESGAKSYAREFGGTWHEMFSPATRRFVAERWAKHFAEENQLLQNGTRRAKSTKQRMLDEFDRLYAESGSHYYVTIYDLRAALPDVGRSEFDSTLNDLRRDWVLTLSPSEGLHGNVPPHVMEAGIQDPGVRHRMVYVLRRQSDPEEHQSNGRSGRPRPPFAFGDRVSVEGTPIVGRIDHGPFWDQHLGDYRYKVTPDDGSPRRTWNGKSLRRAPGHQRNPRQMSDIDAAAQHAHEYAEEMIRRHRGKLPERDQWFELAQKAASMGGYKGRAAETFVNRAVGHWMNVASGTSGY